MKKFKIGEKGIQKIREIQNGRFLSQEEMEQKLINQGILILTSEEKKQMLQDLDKYTYRLQTLQANELMRKNIGRLYDKIVSDFCRYYCILKQRHIKISDEAEKMAHSLGQIEINHQDFSRREIKTTSIGDVQDKLKVAGEAMQRIFKNMDNLQKQIQKDKEI